MSKGFSSVVFLSIALMSKVMFAQQANMAITLQDALTFTVNQPTFLADNSDRKTKKDNQIEAIASDHISVISYSGYIVKASAGEVNGGPGIDGLVRVSSLIGTTNKGNTTGLVFESDVILPPAREEPVTVITAPNCSWNGSYSTNKFNIAYKIGSQFAYIDKNAAPSIIPVIFTVIRP